MDKTLQAIAATNEPGAKSQNEVVAEQQTRELAVKPVEYTELEKQFRQEMIWELNLARDQRDRYHPELDGMTYIEYYESNRKKDLSYIPPKKNKDDVRIVTGTTREKDTTLLNSLLNMNLVPDITAFDVNDRMVNELGDNVSDLVKKSREIEDWDKKRSSIYRELIAQGDVFVQEIYTQDFRMMPTSEITWDPTQGKVSDFTIKRRLEKIFEGCEGRMINGKKVYLGSLRIEHIEDQHLVAVLNILPRDKARAKYRKWERWENVPYTADTITYFDDGKTYKDWNMVTLNDRDKVAEVFVYWPEKNLFMIMLNGVMMLPIDYPLTAISPTGKTPIAQGKLEPITDFCYSKSQPSKTKIDQEVLDETTKLFIRKFRQMTEPPMGNKSKKTYSASIFLAGKITSDIQDGDLFPLLPAGTGELNAPMFQFYQLIKSSIDAKTSSQQTGGDADPNVDTATESNNIQHQQMMSLGLALDGVVNLERRMTWNRIYNILTHWTDMEDPLTTDAQNGITKEISVGTSVDNGQKGTKIFRFSKKLWPKVADQEHEEDQLTKQNGKPTRIVYMNPKVLREIPYRWFIVINPTPKSNDKLSQLMFVQNLTQAINLFGPQSINMDYAKQRFAILINEDPNKLFVKGMGAQSPLSMQSLLNNQNGGQGAPQGGGGQQSPFMGKSVGNAQAAGKGGPIRAAMS